MDATALTPIPAATEAMALTLHKAVLQEAATQHPVTAEVVLLVAAKAMEDLIQPPLQHLEIPTDQAPMIW